MNTCYYCCEPHKQFVQNFGNAPLQINTIRNQIAQKKKRKKKSLQLGLQLNNQQPFELIFES